MEHHEKFIDLKNKKNYEAEIVGLADVRTVFINHNNTIFKVRNNANIQIMSLFNAAQITRLNDFMKKDMSEVIFNVKEKKAGIIPTVEIKTRTGEDISQHIGASIKRFIDFDKQASPMVFLARFKKHKANNIITVATNESEYNVMLDLVHTNYNLYNESDREMIDRIVREKLEDKMLLKISTASYVGFNQLATIKYKKGEEWHNLGDEIRDLINPYEETNDYGYSFKGIVTNVIDGDTIELFNGIKKVKIRLEDIDAPESNQDFGSISTNALTELVYGLEVKVVYRVEDVYQRIVGTIFTKNKDGEFEENVNKKMVEKGMAWSVSSLYKVQEKEARQQDYGIWSEDPVYPKNFRDNTDYFKEKQKTSIKPLWKKTQENNAEKKEKAKKGFFKKK